MKIVKRIFSYILKYKHLFFLSIIFSFTLIFGKISGMLQISSFFTTTFIGENFEKLNIITFLLLISAVIIWTTSHYCVFLFSNLLAANIMRDIRKEIYFKLMEFPVSFFKNNKSGDITSRILNDMSVIEIFLTNIMVELIAQPLTVVIIIYFMFSMNLKLSLYFFSIVPFLAILLTVLGRIVQKNSALLQKKISEITSMIQETVLGIDIIKGFTIENKMKDKFLKLNSEYFKTAKREIKVRTLGQPAAEFLGGIGVLIILLLGAMLVKSGELKAGDIVSFLMLILILAEPLSLSSGIVMVLRKLIPAGERIFEIIDHKDVINKDLPVIRELNGNIVFQHVYFGYEKNKYILKDINLEIKNGETFAICGPSGSGKTTLSYLLSGFYHPDKGRILVGGKDISQYNIYSYRKFISIVTQESFLFSGTILENITISREDFNYNDAILASKMANAHDFIMRLPQGYNTDLGDRGLKISGGERQRITLARALYRKPLILILDEATSSLDSESEELITESLNNLKGKLTLFIIAHKLKTIMNADRIAVIENGKIVEIGTHEELIENKGIYNRLFNIQMSI